jgi:hypothetical protein
MYHPATEMKISAMGKTWHNFGPTSSLCSILPRPLPLPGALSSISGLMKKGKNNKAAQIITNKKHQVINEEIYFALIHVDHLFGRQ